MNLEKLESLRQHYNIIMNIISNAENYDGDLASILQDLCMWIELNIKAALYQKYLSEH